MGNNIKPEEPKITVLTLCYNTGAYVIEALECVKNQTYKNIELIIIDDRSSDNSVELIENWISTNNYKCSFVKNDVNLGIPGVFNVALKITTGKYLTWISDDLWETDRLQKTITIFEGLPENVGVMFGKMEMMNSAGKALSLLDPKDILEKLNCFKEDELTLSPEKNTVIKGKDLRKTLFYKSCILAPSVTVKKSIYDKIGVYDESITVEDLNCWFKVSGFFDFVYVPFSTAKYRLHSSNYTSGLNENYIKSLVTVLKRYSDGTSKNKEIIKKHIREEAFRIGMNLSDKKFKSKAWRYFLKYYLPNFQFNLIAIKETAKLLKGLLLF